MRSTWKKGLQAAPIFPKCQTTQAFEQIVVLLVQPLLGDTFDIKFENAISRELDYATSVHHVSNTKRTMPIPKGPDSKLQRLPH